MLTQEKYKARARTILDAYYARFHQRVLPLDKQYITLAGTQTAQDGSLSPLSEFAQMTKHSGFVRKPKRQYFGFDLKSEIIEENKKVAPKGNWHHMDIYTGLVDMLNRNILNPGLVNFDSMRMPRVGSEELARLMGLLAQFSGVLLIANFVLHRQFHNPAEPVDIFAELREEQQYAFAVQKGWQTDSHVYRYPGHHASMASITFVKYE